MLSLVRKIFGTSHDRAVRRMRPRVAAINALEPEMKALTDAELRNKTVEFREQLDQGASLDDLLVPAFAVVREAGRRTLEMRHFDVQLMGGMVLHKGAIAEMRTGEGKTLVATLAAYLNALDGKGVHIVTVNDYLARRDSEWMGKIYKFLGLTVGVVVGQQSETEKRQAYQCDIAYGQNNEFGFDYLRDNMKFSALDYYQRPLNYAIVDEVDSILIDEARTPLIISGQGERSSEKYRLVNEVVPRLRNEEHYNVDEKGHSVTLTDDGVELAEQMLAEIGALQKGNNGRKANLYDPVNLETLHILNQCLRAHTLYKRDVAYMVREGKVLIIDEFTGRILAGRRWSDGLHQAVEAKENVPIQEENRTLATITFQNLFRIYKKLSGMTGTADTEAAEFHATYKIDVNIVPTNKPMIRSDEEDVVYKTEREKFTAVIDDIIENHERGVPILVGTVSVEKSGAISRILEKKGIEHHVLNAKHHENEAFVVAQAGRLGAITVSTNMAGRGTDIILGGNPEMLVKWKYRQDGQEFDDESEEFKKLVRAKRKECEAEHDEILELGGLYVIGTERHEARRIDNQLRGRSGRQGDPGRSRFYLSLEDDLMRIFAGDRVKNLMERMGMPDGEPIEHPWVTKSVENAQKKVEERNFDIRKHLLEYDDVMNSQRQTVYSLRQQLLLGIYHPEEVDEEGRPLLGKHRKVPLMEGIVDKVRPEIAMLLGMFCADPLTPYDKNGKSREIPRKDFEKAGGMVELESLQKEIYSRWGVKIEIEKREKDAVGLYDECVATMPQALSEQRERALDLIDRIIGAMVEDSCPPNRVPDDWDWSGLFEGFQQHFGTALTDEIADNSDRETLARELYDIAEQAYLAREKDLGLELALRLFRHVYLEELDRAWVEHLTDMDHLRDGIGLRGYGQRDPKQEYKKEGFNMFVNMLARVSSNVVTRLMTTQVRRAAPAEVVDELEADRLEQRMSALAGAMARHGQKAAPAAQLGAKKAAPAPAAAPEPPKPAVEKAQPCPCGSGKPFAECHGAEDDE